MILKKRLRSYNTQVTPANKFIKRRKHINSQYLKADLKIKKIPFESPYTNDNSPKALELQKLNDERLWLIKEDEKLKLLKKRQQAGTSEYKSMKRNSRDD